MSEKIIFSDSVKTGKQRLKDLLDRKNRVVSDLLKHSGIVNLNKNNIESFLEHGSYFMRGVGEAQGKNRAVTAIKDALESLGDFEKNELSEILLSITTDKDTTYGEIEDAENFVEKFCKKFPVGIHVMAGHVVDEKLHGEFKVTMVAKFESLDDDFRRMFKILTPEELIAKINSGFNPNRIDSHDRSFIECVIAYEIPELLRVCIQHGGDVNISKEYSNCEIPLITHLAKNFRHCCNEEESGKYIDMLKILIDAKCVIDNTALYELLMDYVDCDDESRRYFLVFLKILLDAGADFKECRENSDDEEDVTSYDELKKELLTASKQKILKYPGKVYRFIEQALEEYDVEAVKVLIEKLDGDLTCLPQVLLHDIKSYILAHVRANYFPDSSDFPREVREKIDSGSEILDLLRVAGLEVFDYCLRNNLTYVIAQHTGTKFVPGDDFSDLVHVLSPKALRHVLKNVLNIDAEGRDDATYSHYMENDTALSYIVNNYRDYLKPEKMVEILIDAGADVSPLKHTWVGDFSSPKSFWPDDMVQLKILEVLIRKGKLKEVITFDKKEYFNRGNYYRNKNIISEHMLETFNEIFYAEASDKDSSSTFRQYTRLIAASICGTEQEIEEVIKSDYWDVNIKTFLGYTPLMFAAMFNTADAVRCLIKFGADVNARTFQNQTALTLAVLAERGKEKVIETLVKFGADVDEVFENGSNLLMLACEKGYHNSETLSDLIKAGADVNFKRRDGKNALSIAIEKGKFDSAYTLLTAGANPKPLMDLLDTIEI